jgi:hypothetical protein
MGELHVVGVRHHSPACARLVAHVVRRVRPRFVLVEGPTDMNDRIGELALGHELPIAIFSYMQTAATHRASWSPLCAYSPEWIALEEARRVGGEALFIDLPAWHDAFSEVENRYSTRHERASRRMQALCERLGVEDTDSLWDHLFEQPLAPEALAARLTTYFHELREGDDPGDRDRAREAYMSRWIAWAMREAAERGGDVVVVCGGYHEPELRRAWREVHETTRPEVPRAEDGARSGSYLVPYSFRRLDSFVGYESGMPSPEFYQRVWERGADAAGEEMLGAAVSHLRKKKQRVSAADAIAAMTLARGLRTLRGHEELGRVDVLDGLAGAIIKEALDAPLPWNRRGVLARGTDPMLVEIVRAFSGERLGRLAAGTPRPPLLRDVESELARVGIAARPDDAKAQRIAADLTDPRGLEASRILHRLRVLGIPGFSLTRAPSFARTRTSLAEEWSVSVASPLEYESSLIEAAAYGASLEAAAGARLEEQIALGTGLTLLARLLREAALVGIDSLTFRLLGDVRRLAGAEPDFEALGAALAELLALFRYDVLLGAAGAPILGAAIEATFERGLWLFEGLAGDGSEGQVLGARVIRDALRAGMGNLALDAARAESVMARRVADHAAPPPVRGAA